MFDQKQLILTQTGGKTNTFCILRFSPFQFVRFYYGQIANDYKLLCKLSAAHSQNSPRNISTLFSK